MIELLEGLLYRKHSHLSRDEVLEMFHLTPLHKTRAWREMHDNAMNEGLEKGRKEGKEVAQAQRRSQLSVARHVDQGNRRANGTDSCPGSPSCQGEWQEEVVSLFRPEHLSFLGAQKLNDLLSRHLA